MSVTKKDLYKNAFFLTFADAASKGATALLGLLIARFMGPDGYGPYAIATAVAGLFMMITTLGFEEELTRRGGRMAARIQPALKLTFKAVAISCAAALVCIAVFLSFGVYSSQTVRLTLLMAAALVVARFHLPFRHLCLLLGRSKITATIQGVGTGLLVAVTLILIFNHASLDTIVISQLLTAAVLLAVWIVWYKTRVSLDPSLPTDHQKLTEFTQSAFSFAVTNLLWVGYFNAGPFLLSLVGSEADVGLYAAVFRIIAITFIFGYSVANSFTPLLFRSHTEGGEDFHKHAIHLVKLMTIVGLPVSLLFFLYSRPLVHFIIGSQFDAGVPLMRVLSLSVLFRMLNFALSEILTTSGRQSRRIALEASMLGVHVIAALFLIEPYGPKGLADAVLISEFFLFGASVILLWTPVLRPKAAHLV